MKNIVVLFLLLGCAAPLRAQYGPPARDLKDAHAILKEIERQLGPAVHEARDQAAVLNVIARAHNRLAGLQPAEELSRAREDIRVFLERRERNGRPLSRENQQWIDSVQKELELASSPPHAVPALRERLHHEFVHTLERQVLKNLELMDQLREEWRRVDLGLLERAQEEAMSAIHAVATDVQAK